MQVSSLSAACLKNVSMDSHAAFPPFFPGRGGLTARAYRELECHLWPVPADSGKNFRFSESGQGVPTLLRLFPGRPACRLPESAGPQQTVGADPANTGENSVMRHSSSRTTACFPGAHSSGKSHCRTMAFSAAVPLLTLTTRSVHFPAGSLHAVCREISPFPVSEKTLLLYIAGDFLVQSPFCWRRFWAYAVFFHPDGTQRPSGQRNFQCFAYVLKCE